MFIKVTDVGPLTTTVEIVEPIYLISQQGDREIYTTQVHLNTLPYRVFALAYKGLNHDPETLNWMVASQCPSNYMEDLGEALVNALPPEPLVEPEGPHSHEGQYTYADAVKLINQMLIATVKTSANMKELMEHIGNIKPGAADPVGDAVLRDLNPYIYGDGVTRINLTKSMSIMLEKAKSGNLHPIDLFNALSLAHREAILELAYYMRWDTDLPPADIRIVKGWIK